MKSIRILKKAILVLFILSFSACGYKATSFYAKKSVGENVYVDLSVNVEDPKNSVLIKDAMNKLLITRLGSKLVKVRSEANTIMFVKLNSVSMNEIQYDKDGYTQLYRATANINVKVFSNKVLKTFNVSGTYDFSNNTTTISEASRFSAIQSASNKAMELVLSKLAILSFKKK